MQRLRTLTFLVCLLALTGAACAGPSASPSTGPPPSTATPSAVSFIERAAEVSELHNQVEAHETSDIEWREAVEGQRLLAGGGVRTGEASRARIDISGGTILRLAANTEFELAEFSLSSADPVSRLALSAGKVWIAVAGALGQGTFEVQTPSGVASVRGSFMSTEFYPANGHFIATCLEGQCRLTSTTGNFVDLQTGEQSGIVAYGRDPGPPRRIDIVQVSAWATEFPEARQFVATITPGPSPTTTLTPTPGAAQATPTPAP